MSPFLQAVWLALPVVLGGLVSSMFLTMVVLPAIYHLVESRLERAQENA